MKQLVFLFALWLSLTSPAIAGKNAGGAIVVHTDDAHGWTDGVCGFFDSWVPQACESLNTRTDIMYPVAPSLIWFIAAFPESSNPGVHTVHFGHNHNVWYGAHNAWGFCGPPNTFEIPELGWPDQPASAGCSVVFGSPYVVGDRFFPFYHFFVWGETGQYYCSGINPTIGYAAYIADDDPWESDRIDRFGCVTWGTDDGYNNCPADGPQPGACCYENGSCAFVLEVDCAGDSFIPDTPCDPNPCPHLLIVQPDGNGDFPTIQAAIDASIDGDTIELTGGTFTGDGNRDLDFLGKTITVRSQSGDAEACLIDCQGIPGSEHRGFRFHSGEGAEAVLEGITITRGYHSGGGAILSDGASPTINNCIFLGNSSALDGGALDCRNAATPILNNCRFLENHAGDDGGVLLSRDGGSPSLYGCTMSGNTANDAGGAVYLTISGGALISACTVAGSNAPGLGAAVAVVQGASMNMDHTIVAFNGNGTAFYVSSSTVELACCDIYGNAGGDWVGGIEGQYGINGNISEDPLFCAAEVGDLTLQDESPCAEENNAACGQIGAYGVGCLTTDVGTESGAPNALRLDVGRPNPFRDATTIRYQLSEPAHVVLSIHDLSGRLVKLLVDEARSPGAHAAVWDGRDQTGSRASTGVYFVRLVTGTQTDTGRLSVVR